MNTLKPIFPKHPSALFPVLTLLFASAVWGILWYPLRLLQTNGLQGLWATLIIFLTALVVCLPLLLKRRHEIRNPGYFILLALASGWCNTAFILAVLESNVVRVLLLFYLSPLWAVILGRLILGERLSRTAKLTLTLAMSGALIMLWNPEMGFPWPKHRADWLAISAGFAFALSNVLVRKVQNVSVWTKATITFGGVVGVCGGLILFTAPPVPAVELIVVLSAIALGGLGIVAMTWAVLYGVTHMPVHRSAVILLFEIVAGAVSAQLLTDEVVLIREWIGGALIISAALFAALAHAKDPD